jgi:hypothetical protein
VFEQWPKQSGQGSTLLIASFRSPHGIGIDLWGLADEDSENQAEDQPTFEELSVQVDDGELEDQQVTPEEKVKSHDNYLSGSVIEPDSEKLFDIEYINE